MAQAHVIRRTEKLRQLRDALARQRIVYLSSFFHSGKTELMNQLAETLDAPALRFEGGSDGWDGFARQACEAPSRALIVDDLQWLGDGEREALAALLDAPGEGRIALLAGRGQEPACLFRLISTGAIAVFDHEFVMFDKAEIEQLFLEYAVALSPSDVDTVKRELWGYPLAMHALARRMLEAPSAPIGALLSGVREDMKRLLIEEIILPLPEQDRALLFNLSPFERFSDDMARMLTGRTDAPKLLRQLAQQSHILVYGPSGTFSFFPVVREALYGEMKNMYSQDYIDGQYKRAALYYELQNRIPEAIACYSRLGNRERVRELLIRDTHNRPADCDAVELRQAYAQLDEASILASPELMKGMCLIESLLGHAQGSERWYAALKRFAREAPARDARRRVAEEAVTYLDVCLPQRGTRRTLSLLTAAVSRRGAGAVQGRFNIAGNNVSLINGGLDFCRWVPHGPAIYRLFKPAIEAALGLEGSGVGDIAIGECEFENRLDGDYGPALSRVCAGLSQAADSLEMRCAAVGIQSRIIAAMGGATEALRLMESLIASLPPQAPRRLVQNLDVYRLTLKMMTGDSRDALNWLATEAPDETRDFIILDRYRYLLKLRLYIITAQWQKTPLLFATLRQYFDSYDRPYMRIQLHLLQAAADYRTGGDGWQAELGQALALAKRYRLARVIADEGMMIVDMLAAASLPDGAWERGVARLVQRQAAAYPAFMRQVVSRPVFTDREYQVYGLMIAGCRNAKIASILNITERTVKYHTAEIYRKLGVTTRAEALNRAAELGDLR